MKPIERRRLALLAGFAIYFSVLWYFWDSVLVYPLKIFVVLLHEWSHAVALLATGGTLDLIALDPYQGGATLGSEGNPFLYLSAGYLGSLVCGALIVTGSRSKRQVRPRFLTAVVGGTTIALTLLSVRNPFGILFGLVFGTALLAASLKVPPLWNRRILLTLGLTSCLYAILDIKSDILDRPELRSDARMLSELTGVPTVAWGLLWITLALAASALLLRRVYRDA
jgi:hypothetical protein